MSFSGCWVATLAVEVGAIRKGDLNIGRVCNDMQAGQDISVRINDGSGSQAVIRLSIGSRNLGLDENEGGLDDLIYRL